MAWHGSLELDYRLAPLVPGDNGPRTVGRGLHSGPLRVLRSLYPEGPTVCHHVLVHPPGGVAGGDVLALTARLAPGSHALLTTPGATRFYRSSGETASQSLHAQVAEGARLEWLPLETLVHDSARARNRLRFELAAGAETMGWDLLALGLPASSQAFERGRFDQCIEVLGSIGSPDRQPVWLERSVLDFDDDTRARHTRRLLASPLGWAGQTLLATLWFASGTALGDARRERLLDAARSLPAPDPARSGTTSPNPQVVVVRALGTRVEPLMRHLVAVWSAWRQEAWALPACAPRVWRT